MTDTPINPAVDEYSQLDLLQTIVDNLRLLVIGPIVAGLLVLAGASFWPKTYESTVILKAEPVTAGIMLSAAVLDPVAGSLGYTHEMPIEDARLKLKEQINVNFNNKDKLLTLTAQANTAQAAQALAQAVLQQTYTQSQPRDSEKLRLQKQLAQAQTREKEAAQAAKFLSERAGKTAAENSFQTAQAYSQLVVVQRESQNTQIEIEQKLQGLDASALVQQPTLPNKHASLKRRRLVMLAILVAEFALLFFIFIRQAILNGRQRRVR